MHPEDLRLIDDILINKLGVAKHDNPFGKKPYPYNPQGLLSIQQIETESEVTV